MESRTQKGGSLNAHMRVQGGKGGERGSGGGGGGGGGWGGGFKK